TPSTAPTAAADSVNVAENSPGTTLNVTTNDSANVAGGQLGVLSTTAPAHGTVTVQSDGVTLQYKPNPRHVGPHTFGYTVSATVRVATVSRETLTTVNGVNIFDGFGSAIATVPGTTDEFYSLTDRGPNVDGTGGGKVFALPNFTPQIGRFKLANGTLTKTGT